MTNILIPTPLRKFTGNESSVSVEADTVGDAIARLGDKHPGLKPHILDQEGKIRSFVRLYLGDVDILQLDGEDTRLEGESTISIIPAIAGG